MRSALVVCIAVPLLVSIVATPARAQGSAPDPAVTGPTACAGQESHRFDFWPGEWVVESRRQDAAGAWHESRNRWRAEAVLGGCAFADYVDGDFGTGRLRGMGTRYYDPGRDRWFITWMSTEDPGVLETWEGGFDDDGVGTFLLALTTPAGPLLSRIRWWDIRRDSAEWEHAISRDDGATWIPTWRMTLRRAAADPSGG